MPGLSTDSIEEGAPKENQAGVSPTSITPSGRKLSSDLLEGKAHRRPLHFAPPDFLLRLLALAKFLRLSLKKAAYVDPVSFAMQEIRVRFGRDDKS